MSKCSARATPRAALDGADGGVEVVGYLEPVMRGVDLTEDVTVGANCNTVDLE